MLVGRISNRSEKLSEVRGHTHGDPNEDRCKRMKSTETRREGTTKFSKDNRPAPFGGIKIVIGE